MELSKFEQIEQVLALLDRTKIEQYLTYWDSITPSSDREYYWRWIFAFLSVHTSWEKNVDSYHYLYTRPTWQIDGISQLSSLIKSSRVGLQTMRARGIWAFHEDFWKDTKVWYKASDETWVACRKRLMNKLYGLGLAKTAFALELCYPRSCEVVCVDTHIIQLYGFKPEKLSERNYRCIEDHWAHTCQRLNVPSPIARCLYWDTKQKKAGSGYWAYVFEPGRLKQEINAPIIHTPVMDVMEEAVDVVF